MTVPSVSKVKPSNKVASFGWYNFLFLLAGEQYLNIPKVLLTPIDEAFMFALYSNLRSFDEATTIKAIQK